jgi:hypothetical protein
MPDRGGVTLQALAVRRNQVVRDLVIQPRSRAFSSLSLPRAPFEAYVDGLRMAGWQGNRETVRFAYATAASLRYVPFGAEMMASLVDETEGASWADNWAKKRGCTVEDVLQSWGEVLNFLLNVADEARQLADRV